MSAPQSKLTAQGQISVPAEIRRKLGIGPGSVLEWESDGDHVIVRRAGRYSSEEVHRAIFGRAPKRRTIADLKSALAQQVRGKHARN